MLLRLGHVPRDIVTLNECALERRLEVTTISPEHYPRVQDAYVLLPQGVSVASGSGPVVVAPRPMSRDELARIEIAAPETMPTELLVLRMCLGDVRHREVPSGEILEEVRSGRAGAAILPQAAAGLPTCVDLGTWWLLETGLPLPLRVHIARRDLGPERLRDLSAVLGSVETDDVVCDDGAERRQAVRELLARADRLGVYERPVRVEFVE